MPAKKLTFVPKKVTKAILTSLPERSRDVLSLRFGLGSDQVRQTLEAIGGKYGITRERVRQIENLAMATIRKSREYKELAPHLAELKTHLDEFGGIAHEHDFLNSLGKDEEEKNHINFLLVLGEDFVRLREDDDFHHRWTVDEAVAADIHLALRNLYRGLSDEDLISEGEMVERFIQELKSLARDVRDAELAKRWLKLCKKIDCNHMGEWGVAESPNIRTRGMRDYAYLILRRHGSPMHFGEVARAISETFNRKAHQATCHNELIKDDRFVLVGRGLYALKKWGYSTGTVRDVISSIIDKNGPLTKEEILDKVLKERYVKENTILVNLQNNKHFKKDAAGKYATA